MRLVEMHRCCRNSTSLNCRPLAKVVCPHGRIAPRSHRQSGVSPRSGSTGNERSFTVAGTVAGTHQLAAGSGRRAAGSGQRAAGSGQRAAGSGQRGHTQGSGDTPKRKKVWKDPAEAGTHQYCDWLKCIALAGIQHLPTVGHSPKWCFPTVGVNRRRTLIRGSGDTPIPRRRKMDRRFWDSAPNHPLTHLQRCVPSTRPICKDVSPRPDRPRVHELVCPRDQR